MKGRKWCFCEKKTIAEHCLELVLLVPAVLDKGKAVDVTHIGNHRMTFLNPKQIEATHELLEAQDDTSGDFLFAEGQNDGEPHFLSIGIPLDLSIDGGRLSGFGMSVLRSHRVHFDVGALGFDEFFVNVRPVSPDFVDVGIELGRSVPDFAKQFFAASPRGGWIVDGNVVIVGVDGFFDKGFVNANSVDFDVIIDFLDFAVPRSVAVAGSARNVVVRGEIDVTGDVDSAGLQQIVYFSAILQEILGVQIVENKRSLEFHVLLGLGERVSLGVKGNEDVAVWPFLDWFVEDHVVPEKNDVKERLVET